MKNKVLKTVVVIMLIIALTVADIIMVGMNLVTYATDNASSSASVEFVTYFKTDKGETVQAQYEMKNSEIKLYMKVSANSGVGFDGVISLENSNFKFKPSILSEGISKIEGNTITLNRVRAGNTVEIEVGIEPIVDENYQLNMLSKESTLKLTGNYINSEEETVSIEKESKVTLTLLVPSNIEELTSLEAKTITNRIHKIGETDKRIVQIEVNSEVAENVYPIENTTFKVALPEGVESLEVISKGTYATNGQSDRVLAQGTDYTWDKVNKLLQVTIQNESKEGKVSWKQEGKDNIIVTLILDDEQQLSTEEYSIKSNIKFYGEQEKQVAKEGSYNLTAEADGTIRVSIENSENIYKGKIYSKEEREYNSITNIEVNYADLIEGNTVQETTTYKTETEQIKQSNVQYKQTTISKSEFERVLGTEVTEEGKPKATLTIKDQNGNTVKQITTADFDTTGNATITYASGVTGITVEITKAVATGIIRLNHVKVIKAESYTTEEIKELKTLVEQANVTYTNTQYTFERTKTLREPTAEVGLAVTPQTITAEKSNDMQIAVTLKTDNEKYELYKNPIFKFTLPEGVTANSVSEGTLSATDGGLTISRLETNGREIIVEVTGGQQGYVTSDINPQITFKANVFVNKLMANKQDTIKMEYLNKYINEEKVYELKSSTINIKASNSRIVTNLKLENYNGLGTNVEKYSDSNVEVSRKIPMENTEIIEVPIKYTIINNNNSAMSINPIIIADYKDKDGNNQNLINYADIPVTLEAGSMQVIEQVLQIPTGLYFSERIDIKTEAKYTYSGTAYSVENNIELVTEEKEGIREVSLIEDKIQLETFSQLGNGTGIRKDDEIYNEQIVTYIMEVTNISNEPITNLNITNKQINGNIFGLKEVVVTNWAESPEPYIEHEYAELEEDTQNFKIDALNPGESRELHCRVVVKKVAPDNITAANISISADRIEEKQWQTLSNKVKDAELKVSTKRNLREEVQANGGSTDLMSTSIKNLTNEKITNADVRIYLTEGLTYREQDRIKATSANLQELNVIENIIFNKEENYIGFKITSIEANEEINLETMLYIEEIPIEEASKEVSTYVKVNEVISNNIITKATQIKTQITVVQETNIIEGQKLLNGDTVRIVGKISNIGIADSMVTIEDEVPIGLDISQVMLINDNETIDKTAEVINNKIYMIANILAGEQAILVIEGTINTSKIVTETIENVILAKPYAVEEVESNTIVFNIESNVDTSTGEDTEVVLPPEVGPEAPEEAPTVPDEEIELQPEPPSNTKDPDDTEVQGPPTDDPEGDYDPDYKEPGDGNSDDGQPDDGETGDGETGEGETGDGEPGDGEPGDGEPGDGEPDGEKPDDKEPEPEEPTYAISGYAWLDKNKNGTREENEGIKNVTIKVIDINNRNTFLKDKNGNEIQAKTGENGQYNIEKMPIGKYNIIFEYDTNAYELKQSESINDYIVESTNKKVAITNNIDLNSNQTIDIELIELTEFDLKIDKYISKVIVQTANETKTSGYINKQLVKEEIQSKYLTGATVLVEYTMEISNIGELSGYATEIVDYLPEDMEFHSELNTEWYIGEDRNIYNTSLASEIINPAETKTVKLVLLKTMTKNNTGTTTNIAEISETVNSKEYVDMDLSNNQSKAEIIVNPATGSIIAYATAVLNAIAIIALGMWLIKKKVVEKE